MELCCFLLLYVSLGLVHWSHWQMFRFVAKSVGFIVLNWFIKMNLCSSITMCLLEKKKKTKMFYFKKMFCCLDHLCIRLVLQIHQKLKISYMMSESKRTALSLRPNYHLHLGTTLSIILSMSGEWKLATNKVLLNWFKLNIRLSSWGCCVSANLLTSTGSF